MINNDIVGLPLLSQQTKNIVQRRPNIFDVDPPLYKCYTNVLCLLFTGICVLLESQINQQKHTLYCMTPEKFTDDRHGVT